MSVSKPDRPPLRIVGAATDEEVAAVVAVLHAAAAASGAGSEPPLRKPESSWGSPGRRVRGTHRPGFGAWRASGLPH